MKRLYSSAGGQNGADKSRRIEAASVGTSFINSFFKIHDSSAGIHVAVAVVENADTAEEESNVSPVCQRASIPHEPMKH